MIAAAPGVQVEEFKYNLLYEKSNLDGNIISLVDFLESPNSVKLTDTETSLLIKQRGVMKQYSSILESRIKQYL